MDKDLDKLHNTLVPIYTKQMQSIKDRINLAVQLASQEGSVLCRRHLGEVKPVKPIGVQTEKQRTRPATMPAILTIEQIRQIDELRLQRLTLREIAEKIGCCHRTIWFVVNRRGAYKNIPNG